MALSIIFLVQNLHYYILLRGTRVMADSNPMQYLLSNRVIQGHDAKCIVIF